MKNGDRVFTTVNVIKKDIRKKFFYILTQLLSLNFLLLGNVWSSSTKTIDEKLLKEECLKATIKAIKMKIKTYELRLESAINGAGDPTNIPALEKRIKELRQEVEKYKKIKTDDYPLPEKKTVTIVVNEKLKEDSLLNIEEMTRSDPFYHISGIHLNDYSRLKVSKRYTAILYLVFRRDYPFPSYYVYISEYSPTNINVKLQEPERILQERRFLI